MFFSVRVISVGAPAASRLFLAGEKIKKLKDGIVDDLYTSQKVGKKSMPGFELGEDWESHPIPGLLHSSRLLDHTRLAVLSTNEW